MSLVALRVVVMTARDVKIGIMTTEKNDSCNGANFLLLAAPQVIVITTCDPTSEIQNCHYVSSMDN